MNPPQTSSGFQTTHWSVVLGVGSNPALLEDLLKTYWGPIYAFIRRSGYNRDQAADLTQEFIAQIILERGLIAKADPERGRFRTLLKSSLKNFLIDQHRRASSLARSPRRPMVGSDKFERIEPSESDDPGSAFDRQWAATLLEVALERVEADCCACGQERHWKAFEATQVRPYTGHAEAPSLSDVARELQLESPTQVSSMNQTVRRKFRRALLEVIRETVHDPHEAEDEYREIFDR
jgi:RNA polymerase sigma factor (sigma-70 family)